MDRKHYYIETQENSKGDISLIDFQITTHSCGCPTSTFDEKYCLAAEWHKFMQEADSE